MARKSTSVYRFSDVLALARQSWVSQVASGLAKVGYPDYRRSDSALLRLLQGGPMSVGRIGGALGVTRQAARKAVAGLEERGLAQVRRDQQDGRQLNVALTETGNDYAIAIARVIDRLNGALAKKVTTEQLAAADAVLRALFADARTRARADSLVPPPIR